VTTQRRYTIKGLGGGFLTVPATWRSYPYAQSIIVVAAEVEDGIGTSGFAKHWGFDEDDLMDTRRLLNLIA
jgi:hypothetical protein